VRGSGNESTAYFKHIGLYVYRRDLFAGIPGPARGSARKGGRLEQLRALENGHRIRVVETEYESLGSIRRRIGIRVSALFEKLMVTR